MKNIILINGLPRAGKDTSADFITEYGYTKLFFAYTMKSIIAETFDITLEELDTYKNDTENYLIHIKDDSTRIKSTNFREILQRFGSEGMKPIFGLDIWSRLLYEYIEKKNIEKVVVSDFRFLSEYRKLPGYNVYTILIKDDRELPTEGHASDVELYQNNFKFDYIIENTGTLDELNEKLKQVLKEID